jgi:DNA repair protein RecO (recombination protein O)
MPSYRARVLVLRKTRLGETDTILTLLAEDGRQVRAVAKGLRKPGGRFGARLEPFAVADLMLHSGRTLDVVTEAVTVSSNAALREDYDRAAAAAVVADLLDKISVEGQPEERLFALATATLDALWRAPLEELPAVVVAFLLKALAMHGYRPEIDVCALCGAPAGLSDLVSPAAGGVLCERCGVSEAGALPFSAEGRAWLARLMGARMAEVPALGMPDAAVRDCFVVVRAFVTYYVPAKLRALDYYAANFVD